MTRPTFRSARELLDLLAEYRAARRAFLASLEIPESNRDPLAEFSEKLVAALFDGQVAVSRVQKGYDFATPQGEKVQVKYLTNPADRGVNGIEVRFTEELDLFLVVIIEALDLVAVLTFSSTGLGQVRALLGKRHGDQNRTVQLSRRDYRQIISERERFAQAGVHVFLP